MTKRILRTRLIRYVMLAVRADTDWQQILADVSQDGRFDLLLGGKTTDEQEEYIMNVIRFCERSLFPNIYG
jgi:hypothetical protein